MESNNNRQLFNSLNQLNPMSVADNVLSMRKKLDQEYKGRNISHQSEGSPISSEVPCVISKGGPCMKQVPVLDRY